MTAQRRAHCVLCLDTLDLLPPESQGLRAETHRCAAAELGPVLRQPASASHATDVGSEI